ncbi:MAG: hypothetical protein AAF525_04655 [Pseudomonadota bacterium]
MVSISLRVCAVALLFVALVSCSSTPAVDEEPAELVEVPNLIHCHSEITYTCTAAGRCRQTVQLPPLDLALQIDIGRQATRTCNLNGDRCPNIWMPLTAVSEPKMDPRHATSQYVFLDNFSGNTSTIIYEPVAGRYLQTSYGGRFANMQLRPDSQFKRPVPVIGHVIPASEFELHVDYASRDIRVNAGVCKVLDTREVDLQTFKVRLPFPKSFAPVPSSQ